MTQSPNRLEGARNEREAEVLQAALDRKCRTCGEPPGRWCFRVHGEMWTLHVERVIEAGGLTSP